MVIKAGSVAVQWLKKIQQVPLYLRFVLPLDVPRNFPFFGVVEERQIEQREATVANGRAARGRCGVTSAAGS